jgi:hypothetical protein
VNRNNLLEGVKAWRHGSRGRQFGGGWVDRKIPALEGKSPREAVKSADGRESVEALLRDAERDRGRDAFTVEANRKGTRRVRELLGL